MDLGAYWSKDQWLLVRVNMETERKGELKDESRFLA